MSDQYESYIKTYGNIAPVKSRINHANILPVRMSRVSSRQRQLVITFTDPETAAFFDSLDDTELVYAIERAMWEA